ncbi:MAG TPA: lipoprotein-releasing system ATP-binding protein LolD [Bdellovibrionales bacterium]|nr:lipoprotein-releasing system ATP-binding protein LolD [Pseudobdellovibrionaceae bacterium]HAG90391.1 lipoprotein-releasing system ATP-binding protein LolD [Bdellovibrionales bacterium]|tara:strand:- start:936 stop:1589 length:654 start_codon:yes stop_codon:yes gene_type:complete
MIKADSVSKSYGSLQILKNLSFEVVRGEAVCILGASGAGKSTFLHLLGTLDKPTSGRIFWNNVDLVQMSEEDLAQLRNKEMGFVFQFHHLLPEFTAVENVTIPGRIAGQSPEACRRKAREVLADLGLSHRFDHYPSELSGGEQQRVAIARALFNEPQILFADEPTGNLDSENSQKIQELFFHLKKDRGLTLVVVTHDASFSSKFPRSVRMADGSWVF